MKALAAVRTIVLLVMVLAATVALERAARYAYHACKPNAQVAKWALAWRVGGPAWRDLETFTQVIAGAVPAGSTVAFRAAPIEHHVSWRAAYLLPQLEIRPVGRGNDLSQADYAAVFRGAREQERMEGRLELVASHPLGNVYRIAREP